jgi:hypothetical protein
VELKEKMFFGCFFRFRFLATGDSYSTISTSFRVGKATVAMIVKETFEAIWEKPQPFDMPNPDKNHWERSIECFHAKWQFPNCLGALDGKHVLIFAPNNSGSMLFNYKKYFHSLACPSRP